MRLSDVFVVYSYYKATIMITCFHIYCYTVMGDTFMMTWFDHRLKRGRRLSALTDYCCRYSAFSDYYYDSFFFFVRLPIK